jgi:hypothetical protein
MYSFANFSTKGFTPLDPTQEIGVLFDQLLEKPITSPIGIKHRETVRVFLTQRFIGLVEWLIPQQLYEISNQNYIL